MQSCWVSEEVHDMRLETGKITGIEKTKYLERRTTK